MSSIDRPLSGSTLLFSLREEGTHAVSSDAGGVFLLTVCLPNAAA